MEDTAPEPVLVEQLEKLATETEAMDFILAARVAECGGQRFRAAHTAAAIASMALRQAHARAAEVAEKPVEGTRRGRFLITPSGRRFWPLDPKPEDCDAKDMAISLCQKARWNGLMAGAFTVGEHSIRVARVAVALVQLDPLLGVLQGEEAARIAKKLYRYGITHDLNEAYLPDMPRPLKEFIVEWLSIEGNVQRVAEVYLGLAPMPAEFEAIIAKADLILLVLEAEMGFTEFDPHERVGLPHLEDIIPASNVPAIRQVAAMTEQWPRSMVRDTLMREMTAMLVERAQREHEAEQKAQVSALVPNAGLREDDPSPPSQPSWARMQETASEPVDLEEQLKRAEAASKANQ